MNRDDEPMTKPAESAPPKPDLPGVDAILSETYGGEPFFTLRGQDVFAPALVTAWALLAARHGCPPEKVSAAFATAKAMQKWPNCKHPD